MNAAKDTISGEDKVWRLVAHAAKVVVASGKKIFEYDPFAADKQELLAKISGRTGNLRAPTLRIGDTFYIGYNAELYQRICG